MANLGRRVVFVRHGQKLRPGDDQTPITDLGRETATKAAQWLSERVERPVFYFHTKYYRTLETAEVMARTLPGEGLSNEKNIPANPKNWDERLDGIFAKLPPDATPILVGHHGTQDLIFREMGGAAFGEARDFRERQLATFILERTADGWRCQDVFPGVLKTL